MQNFLSETSYGDEYFYLIFPDDENTKEVPMKKDEENITKISVEEEIGIGNEELKPTNGRSLSFVKNRIANGYANNIPIGNLNKASEACFEGVFNLLDSKWKTLYHDNVISVLVSGVTLNGIKGKRRVTIKYDTDAEFEYCAMTSCICDGTMIFFVDCVRDMYQRLIEGETYNKETAPIDYEKNVFNYSIVYTVGDFVTNIEDGEFGTEEKPWLTSRFSVYLPIKCEYVRNE